MEKASPDAQYIVGVGHFDAKRYAEAIPALKVYLDAKPNGDVAADALALLAIAHQELGQSQEANAALDRLTSTFPNSKVLAQARLRLGEAALDAKDYDRAAGLLGAAADATTDPAAKVRALWSLGWAQLDGKHPTEAAATFAKLLQDAPQNPLAPDATLARACALDEAGKSDAALVIYTQAAQQYAANPRAGAAATLARARLLDRLGRHTEAAAAFDRYLKDHPKPTEGGASTDVVLAEFGWALLDAGKRPDGMAVFRRILDEFPASPRANDARVALAESAHADGKLDEVETLLAPIVADGTKADPALIQSALFRLGLARFDHRDWTKAADAFTRLLTRYADGPLAPKARFWKAETAFQAGDTKTAEAEFAAILKGPKPTGDTDWLATARLRHIESLVGLEKWSDALTEADALEIELPQFPARHELDYARGRALLGLARFDEARVAFQAVVEANRADDFAARAQLMQGETYFHQQKYNEALKEYLRVVYNYDAPAFQAAALFEAGQIAEKLDHWSDAADFYRQVMSKYSADPVAKKAAQRLEAVKPKLAPGP